MRPFGAVSPLRDGLREKTVAVSFCNRWMSIIVHLIVLQ